MVAEGLKALEKTSDRREFIVFFVVYKGLKVKQRLSSYSGVMSVEKVNEKYRKFLSSGKHC